MAKGFLRAQSGGVKLSYNLFCRPDEPAIKRGLWIKTPSAINFNDVIVRKNFVISGHWAGDDGVPIITPPSNVIYALIATDDTVEALIGTSNTGYYAHVVRNSDGTWSVKQSTIGYSNYSSGVLFAAQDGSKTIWCVTSFPSSGNGSGWYYIYVYDRVTGAMATKNVQMSNTVAGPFACDYDKDNHKLYIFAYAGNGQSANTDRYILRMTVDISALDATNSTTLLNTLTSNITNTTTPMLYMSSANVTSYVPRNGCKVISPTDIVMSFIIRDSVSHLLLDYNPVANTFTQTRSNPAAPSPTSLGGSNYPSLLRCSNLLIFPIGSISKTLFLYNIDTDTWSRVTIPSDVNEGYPCFVYQNMLYIFAERANGTYKSVRLNLETLQWEYIISPVGVPYLPLCSYGSRNGALWFGSNYPTSPTIQVMSIIQDALTEGALAILNRTDMYKTILVNIDKALATLKKYSTTVLSDNYKPTDDYYFGDAWLYTDGAYQAYPTYYGNGTAWIKFKN